MPEKYIRIQPLYKKLHGRLAYLASGKCDCGILETLNMDSKILSFQNNRKKTNNKIYNL